MTTIIVGGTANAKFTHAGGQVDSGIVIEWDLDNDGDFSEAAEDITQYVTSGESSQGRDWPSQLTGKAGPGDLSLQLNNSDNRFSYFNSASPLNTPPFSLESGRKIRVRTTGTTNPDPSLLAVDRFSGTGALGSTENGITWVDQLPGFARSGGAAVLTDPSALATIDVTQNGYYIQTRSRHRDASNAISIIYNFTDSSNYGAVEIRNNVIEHLSIIAGAHTTITTVAIENRSNVTFGVHINGTNADIYLDGVKVIAGDTTATTATSLVGIRAHHNEQRTPAHDEFYVWSGLPVETEGIIWTGEVASVVPSVSAGPHKTAELRAEGTISKLARVDVDDPPFSIGVTSTSAGVTSGLMVGNTLAGVSLLHPPGPISAGDFRLGAVGLDPGRALNLCRRFEEVEFGFLHETNEGHIAFDARSDRGAGTVQALFSDDPTAQYRYESFRLLDWRRELINRSRAQLSPKQPTVFTVGGGGASTAAGVTNNVGFTIATAASGVTAGMLMIVWIASTIQGAGVNWVTPPGWVNLRDSGDLLGKERIYAKKLTAADLGVSTDFYLDTTPDGGAYRFWSLIIDDWFGSVATGVQVAETTGFGVPTSQTEANSGDNDPPVLLPLWGRAPTLFAVTRSGMVSTTGGGIVAAASDANAPNGYGNMFSAFLAGTVDAFDVAHQLAIRDGVVSVEDPSPFLGDFLGFDHVEASTVAVRGFAGDPPESAGGQVREGDDSASQDKHNAIFSHTNPAKLFADTADADAYNQIVLSTFSNDRPITELSFTATKSAPLRAQAIRRRVGHLIQVEADNNTGMGIDSTQIIEHIRHRWSDGVRLWDTEWQLSPTGGTGGADPDEGNGNGGNGGAPAAHSVTFRTQQDLAYTGSPDHVLTALGHTSTAKISRADLDGILDAWVSSTGGTTRTVTSAATWTTAMAAALPGDLIRVTAGFDPGGNITARGNLYGISGSNLTASPAGGTTALPIVVTCADGVYVDDNNTSSNTAVLDLTNCRHVWAVGFNVRDGQFGIRCMNWGGSSGSPAYVAYCNIENTGHAGLATQGWFQLITSSGGTPPAGAGNEWGFSEQFVLESNTIDGTGTIAAQFGEGIYAGRGSVPGWTAYCKDFWIRGNDVIDWASDGVDIKPGSHRGYITDNEIHRGHAVFGAPMSILYVAVAIDFRPAAFDFDPEIWVEGNRVYDSDLTNVDGSSTHIMGYFGLSGVRVANNVFWAKPESGTHPMWRARNEHGLNDTEALTYFRADPTWLINNTCWGDDSFENAGYGNPFVGAFPGTITFDLRNNIVDQASPATGEVDAAASDFIATVPAIGVVGDAEWMTFGNGSAFDLAVASALVAAGASITDITFLIDADISGRAFVKATPNPGALQPFVP